MDLTKVHHVAVIGSSYEKSKQFYTEILGFKVIRENYRRGRGDWKIDLQLADMELELFIVPDRPARPTNPEAYGLRHLAFHVDSVEKTVKALAAKGVACEPIRIDSFTNKKMTFFFDPDGLPLELHE